MVAGSLMGKATAVRTWQDIELKPEWTQKFGPGPRVDYFPAPPSDIELSEMTTTAN